MTIQEMIEATRAQARELINERRTHTDQIHAIAVACERDERDPNDAEAGRVRRAQTEIRRIDDDPKMRKLETLLEAQREDEVLDAQQREVHPGARSPYDDAPEVEWRAGRNGVERREAAQSSGFVRTHDRLPATIGRTERWADNQIVRAQANDRDQHLIGMHGSLGEMVRAMSTTTGSALIPEVWAGDIIDRARNVSAVLQAGAEIVPMDSKQVHIGRITGDPTAAFRTEGSTITASDPTFDNVTLDAKTMSTLVVGSMEWFQDSDNVDQLVSNAIAQAFALQLDLVGLYGGITAGAGAISLATPPNPRGVLGTLNANAPSSVLGAATNGTAQTAGSAYNELIDLIYTPQQYNETPNAMIWNAKAALQYAKQYDTTGQPLVAPEAVKELTKYVSNQVPSYTQGTMTNRATDVFVGDWSQLLIGQRLGVTIQTLTERYAENGQIGIIAHWRGDVGLARPRAFAVYKALQGSL